MIFLILCWIFFAIIFSIEAAKDEAGAWLGDEVRYDFLGRVFKIVWASSLSGTIYWGLLEGLYYVSAPYFSFLNP